MPFRPAQHNVQHAYYARGERDAVFKHRSMLIVLVLFILIVILLMFLV